MESVAETNINLQDTVVELRVVRLLYSTSADTRGPGGQSTEVVVGEHRPGVLDLVQLRIDVDEPVFSLHRTQLAIAADLSIREHHE